MLQMGRRGKGECEEGIERKGFPRRIIEKSRQRKKIRPVLPPTEKSLGRGPH